MAYDGPGVRVKLTASRQHVNNTPAVEKNLVGWAVKSSQVGLRVAPDADEITEIAAAEQFVLMVGGVHELELTGGLAGVSVGDRLYIQDAADDPVTDAPAGGDFYPLGVVQEIDTSRTPDVARVNTNAWQAEETFA